MAVGYRKGSGEADLIYFEVIGVGCDQGLCFVAVGYRKGSG